MTNKPLGYIKYKNRYHEYYVQSLGEETDGSIEIIIPSLGFRTGYIREDLALFLEDVENILDMHQELVEEEKKKETVFRFRLTAEEKERIEQQAKDSGYKSTSSFVRDLALAGM